MKLWRLDLEDSQSDSPIVFILYLPTKPESGALHVTRLIDQMDATKGLTDELVGHTLLTAYNEVEDAAKDVGKIIGETTDKIIDQTKATKDLVKAQPMGFGPGDVPKPKGGDQPPGGGDQPPPGGLETAIGIGQKMGLAGMSGAMAGLQAGGPMGAAAGFAADLIMSNESMQEAMGEINEALMEAFAPVAEAIAPLLKELVPIIKDLVPLIRLALAIIRPLLLVIREILRGIAILTDNIEQLSMSSKEFKEEMKRWGEKLETILKKIFEPLKALAEILNKIRKILKGMGGGLFAAGGDISAGSFGIVGEKGPELIVPRHDSTIIPNNALGATNEMNINITVTDLSDHQVTKMIRRLEEAARLGRFNPGLNAA